MDREEASVVIDQLARPRPIGQHSLMSKADARCGTLAGCEQNAGFDERVDQAMRPPIGRGFGEWYGADRQAGRRGAVDFADPRKLPQQPRQPGEASFVEPGQRARGFAVDDTGETTQILISGDRQHCPIGDSRSAFEQPVQRQLQQRQHVGVIRIAQQALVEPLAARRIGFKDQPGRQGHPDVFVFRNPDPPMVRLDDPDALRTQEQWERVKAFWETWFVDADGRYKAAFQNFASVDDFEAQLDRLLRDWLKEKILDRRAVLWPIELKGSPFRGLAAFGAKHTAVFFGRSRDITRAVDEWKEAAARGTPFLVVIGASGVGKSSLARAGLVPRLTASGVVPAVDLWRVAVMHPSEASDGPLMSLAARLFDGEQDIPDDEQGRPPALPEIAKGDYSTPAQLARLFAEAGPAASTPVIRALDRAAEFERVRQGSARRFRAQLLIVVDQLDELFAPDVPAEQRAVFVRLLASLVETGQVWLLATLRVDLYQRFQAEPGLLALKTSGADYDLLPPGKAELKEIVEKPAIRWETKFYSGDAGFQPQIPEAAECDIVIGIFRHRIGPELPPTFAPRLPDGSPYPSGTAYEVLSAIEACSRS
jgi:hypothetical protein